MHYVLIHGSWHGAWCWKHLSPLLAQKNHSVFCLELPGHGADYESASHVKFIDLYEAVYDAINQAKEPVVVVAHSFAGLPTAIAGEACHKNIKHIFYIAAWLPFNGKSLIDMAVSYNNSNLPNIFIDSNDKNIRAIDSKKAADFFYHDCMAGDRRWASQRLRAKPARPDHEKMPGLNPINTIDKSSYILCSADRVVNPLSQTDMAQKFGFKSPAIKSINSGHSPFLSVPYELCEAICL